MRMLKPRRKLNLTTESIDVDSGAELGWKNLYDDLSAEICLGCHEYSRHSRTAKLPVNPVGSAEYFLQLCLKVGGHGVEYAGALRA
jgi:hypothetical protein